MEIRREGKGRERGKEGERRERRNAEEVMEDGKKDEGILKRTKEGTEPDNKGEKMEGRMEKKRYTEERREINGLRKGRKGESYRELTRKD